MKISKMVNMYRKFQIPWKCAFEISKHLILPCFSHRSEGNEFLMDKFVTFVESTFGYK